LPRLLVEPLAKQSEGKGGDPLLFPGTGGEDMRPSRGIGGWFAGSVKRSGGPRITSHGLRHTAASLSVSAGANAKAMLGHPMTSMTLDVYSDLFPEDLDAVADALGRAFSEESVGRMWARSS
jgi:integrase